MARGHGSATIRICHGLVHLIGGVRDGINSLPRTTFQPRDLLSLAILTCSELQLDIIASADGGVAVRVFFSLIREH